MDEHKEPLINHNPSLQSYYASWETRLGFRFILGGTKHYGYYQPNSTWPFPITAALRRMEDYLFNSMKLQPGASVLEAGCGTGHVAMHFASKGVQVYGIDIVKNHVRWAQQGVKDRGFAKSVTIRLMDYHHLQLPDSSFDGVYTIEALCHATDPEKVLEEFFRVLKPGGSIALFDYHRLKPDTISSNFEKSLEQFTRRTSMAAWPMFQDGVLQSMLERQGFQNIVAEDLSGNIKPMVMLFYYMAFIPFLIIRFLGLEAWFLNTQAGFLGPQLQKRRLWRYVAVTARKPAETSDDSGLHERKIGSYQDLA